MREFIVVLKKRHRLKKKSRLGIGELLFSFAFRLRFFEWNEVAYNRLDSELVTRE